MKIKKLLFVLLSVSLLSACEFSFKSGKGDEVKEKKVCFLFCPKKIEKKEERKASYNITDKFYGSATPEQRDVYKTAKIAFQNNDFKTAGELLEKLAKQGVAQAQNDLGFSYAMNGNYQQAKYWLELSAGQNHPMGLNGLGTLYMNGWGVEQNYTKGKEYFELSMLQNYAPAQTNMGILHLYAWGVEQDYAKAKEYFELALQQNDDNAKNSLGVMYLKGLGVPQDKEKAIAYFKEAAEQGNQFAIDNLKNLGQ